MKLNQTMNMKRFIYSIALLLTCWQVQAGLEEYKYYQDHLANIQKSQNKELVDSLYKAISNNKSLSYKQARTYLFGQIYLEESNGQYFINDTYCEKKFGENIGVGPNEIPDHTKLNCEHTWPQSRFNSRQNSRTQKGDLHHLFPVDSRANSTRGNIRFGDVDGQQVNDCPLAERGDDIYAGTSSFEPPKSHKGNVARALFYFSVRYKISIDESEEVYLRQWDKLDPVDQDEISRHEQIYKIQGNRNPFIDDPTLADQIDNF